MTPENAQDVVQLLRTRAVNEHIDFQDHKNRAGNQEGFELLYMNEDTALEIRKLREDLTELENQVREGPRLCDAKEIWLTSFRTRPRWVAAFTSALVFWKTGESKREICLPGTETGPQCS